MVKRLQNRVATGKLTLLGTSIYGLVVAMAIGALAKGLWIQSVCLALATELMVILNNSNSLIRVYSRLVSCSFLVLCLAASFLLPSYKGAAAQILFVLMLQMLFKSYQQKDAPATLYYAFVCLGGISILFTQVVFYLPVLILMAFTSLQAGSFRNLAVAVFGFLTPYWCLLPVSLFKDNGASLINHAATITDFGPIADGLFEPHLLITVSFIATLGIIGCIHYLHYSFEDNIRTRMFYNTLMMIFITTLVFIILQPQQYDLLLRILIISASPLIAQYFVFTHSRLSNFVFIITSILTIALTAYNAWIG